MREIKKIIKFAKEHGFIMEYTNSGHLRFTHETSGAIVFGPKTTTNRNSLMNVRARMKRVLRSG